jgi:hypothetical protein
VPYHIGNGWGGGLVPFITAAAYASTGSLAWALAYPIALPAVAFLISLFLMPETNKRSIWAQFEEVQPAPEAGPAVAMHAAGTRGGIV